MASNFNVIECIVREKEYSDVLLRALCQPDQKQSVWELLMKLPTLQCVKSDVLSTSVDFAEMLDLLRTEGRHLELVYHLQTASTAFEATQKILSEAPSSEVAQMWQRNFFTPKTFARACDFFHFACRGEGEDWVRNTCALALFDVVEAFLKVTPDMVGQDVRLLLIRDVAYLACLAHSTRAVSFRSFRLLESLMDGSGNEALFLNQLFVPRAQGRSERDVMDCLSLSTFQEIRMQCASLVKLVFSAYSGADACALARVREVLVEFKERMEQNKQSRKPSEGVQLSPEFFSCVFDLIKFAASKRKEQPNRWELVVSLLCSEVFDIIVKHAPAMRHNEEQLNGFLSLSQVLLDGGREGKMHTLPIITELCHTFFYEFLFFSEKDEAGVVASPALRECLFGLLLIIAASSTSNKRWIVEQLILFLDKVEIPYSSRANRWEFNFKVDEMKARGEEDGECTARRRLLRLMLTQGVWGW